MRYFILALMMAVNFGLNTAGSEARDMVVQDGRKVAFDYTLTVDGKVIDSSEGKKPLEYTHGEGKLIPGLSRQLEGLRVGEEKTIVVPPEEAYGKPDPAALQEIPLSDVPKDIKLEPGLQLQSRDASGRVFFMRVVKIKKDTVVMDLNHPLAGKVLNFKVKIVSIK